MLSILLSMFLFCLAGAISPGPVNLIAASIGANAGLYKALPHVTGASISYTVIVGLMGAGLHAILLSYPQITHFLQFAGAGYLLYLSAKIAAAKPVLQQSQQEHIAGMMQGVLSQSLNPKAWLVAMSGVSLFVTAGEQHSSMMLLVFCSISGVVCFFSVVTWAALGKLIGKWLNHDAYQVMFNRSMAFLLAATVVSMLCAA